MYNLHNKSLHATKNHKNSQHQSINNTLSGHHVKESSQELKRANYNKTTSPLLKSQSSQLQSSLHLQNQFSSNLQAQETRIRKFSKEIASKKVRFADLIVILGLKYNDFVGKLTSIQSPLLLEHTRILPSLIDSYPSMSIPEVAREHSYVDNLQWVCFPKKYVVNSYDKKKEGQLCKHKIFHFIITNAEGQKKYITSIQFKVLLPLISLLFLIKSQELFLTEKKGAFIVPKSICVISSLPIFTLQKYSFYFIHTLPRQLLSLLFQKVILKNNSASIKAHSQPSSLNYIPFLNEYAEDFIKQNSNDYLAHKIEFYFTIFFQHLYHCDEVENDIEVEEKRDRTNTPSARIGTNKISTTYFKYRNTKSYGFSLENYSFELLLQSIKPERILQLITALLLERKIILIKKKFGDIALIMESLVSLLNPLKWNFVFITYLTPKLLDCLEAPFPYIIGVSKKIWEDQCIIRELPDDIIIYDIDNQEMLNQVREELPPLPEPQASILSRSLKDLLDMKDRFVDGLVKQQSNRISREKIDEYYWGYAQLRIKQSFLNFFLLTINNYIGYFKNLDEEGDMSPNKKEKKCKSSLVSYSDHLTFYLVYDKLASNDVFDFDSYLSQFEGKNKDFMDRLMKTQSFNNFIEDTYQNVSDKTPIGFFRTNMDVLINYSFKKLKKEQNKLIEKLFYNLQNVSSLILSFSFIDLVQPIKFKVDHMFKVYKEQLFLKHKQKFKQLLAEEEGAHVDSSDDNVLLMDIEQRDDLFEKLLLEEVEGNSKQQLSLINGVNSNLMSEMPGIQYEQINMYKQMKSQRSEQSLERKGFESQQIHKKMFQKTMQESQQEELSYNKSRNLNKILISRSGDKVNQENNDRNYKQFLLMADNKKISQSEEDSYFYPHLHHETESKHQKANALQKQQSTRVQSENSFHKNFGSLNKTVIDSKIQRAPTTLNSKIVYMKGGAKTNNESSQVKTSQLTLKQLVEGGGAGGSRLTQSPHMNSHFKQQHSIQSYSQASFIGLATELQKPVNPSQVIKGTIAQNRSKHGLQLRSDDRQNLNYSSTNINMQSPPNAFQNNTIDMLLSGKCNHSSSNQQLLQSKLIPKSKIDLMNPGKKKQSRNEERKQAQKKGMLRFESHQSFYSFYSPKEEEFNKLLLKLKLEQQNPSIEAQQNFTQYTQSKVEVFSEPYDEAHKNAQSKNQILGKNSNHINFSKRNQNVPAGRNKQNQEQYQDPSLTTNINFKRTFIQQKAQANNQSPSVVTNTENSNSKQSPHLVLGEDGEVVDISIVDQSPYVHINKRINDAINKRSPNQSLHLDLKTTNFCINPTLNNFKKSLKSEVERNTLDKLKRKVQTNAKTTQEQYDIELEEECNENRPLKQDESQLQQMTMGLKQNKIMHSDSPSNSIAFKTFNMPKKDKELVPQSTKTKKPLPSQNKSPVNQQQSFTQKPKSKPIPKTQAQKKQPATDKTPGAKHQSSATISKFQSKTQSQQVSSRQKSTQQKIKPPSIMSSLLHQDSLIHQQSLRISPIPDLSQTLDLSKERFREEDQLNEMLLPQQQIQSPQTMQGAGAGGYGSRKSSQTKQPSLGSKNLFNYNSTSTLHRVSEKAGKGDLEVFGKSKQMFKGQIFPSTTRHYQKHSLIQRKTQNNSEYQSCRSSNLVTESKKRSSELVAHSNRKVMHQMMQQRSSGNLEMYKQKGFDEIYEEGKLELGKNSVTDNNTLCNYYSAADQQSDIVSQGNHADGPNNISISILKSSPRFIQNSNVMGQFKQRPPLNKGNFLIQGGSQSLQTSMDMSNIHHFLNAFKSNMQNQDLSEIRQQLSPSLYQDKITLSGILEGMPNRSTSVETMSKLDEQKRLKQVQSPQTSSLITSSNKYLKSLQSHEFQKNESDRKDVKHQQSDLLKLMSKHHHQHSHNEQSHNTMKLKSHANKVEEHKKSKYKSTTTHHNHSKKNSQHEGCRSTKNQQKDMNLDEINNYNETIQRLDVAKKQAQRCQKKGLNILEEALTSQTHSRKSYQSSSSSFASSPNQNYGDFKSSKIFKTTLQASQTQKEDIMPQTIRNNGVPIKKFAFQEYEVGKDNQHSEVIDFPRQMEQDKYVELHRDGIDEKDRTSKLMMEIDQLMEMGSTLNRRGSQGSRLLVNNRGGRESHSQCGQNQPLIEIKYSSNEQNIDANQRPYHRHGNSEASLNDSKIQSQGFQIGDQQLGNDEKRSLRPHGQTTCFIFPSKDSMDYIKRDLNQDVFCKISSHQGDVDKDPHTPKSQGSPRSIEKNRRKFQEKRKFMNNTGSINSLQMTMFSSIIHKQSQQQDEHQPQPQKEDLNTPSRHSSSVDERHKIQNGMVNRLKQQSNGGSFELAPFQGNRKQEDVSYNEVRMGQSDEILYDGQREKYQENRKLVNLNSQVIQKTKTHVVQYEILFEDSDLKDTEDKFTSRDENFSKLKAQRVTEQ